LEVGTIGVFGGQARVAGVQDAQADLTNNVNIMANNLTIQVRSIAAVIKAVARGDLSKFVEVDVHGEMLHLTLNINSMVKRLFTLANEVTRESWKSEYRENSSYHPTSEL